MEQLSSVLSDQHTASARVSLEPERMMECPPSQTCVTNEEMHRSRSTDLMDLLEHPLLPPGDHYTWDETSYSVLETTKPSCGVAYLQHTSWNTSGCNVKFCPGQDQIYLSCCRKLQNPTDNVCHHYVIVCLTSDWITFHKEDIMLQGQSKTTQSLWMTVPQTGGNQSNLQWRFHRNPRASTGSVILMNTQDADKRLKSRTTNWKYIGPTARLVIADVLERKGHIYSSLMPTNAKKSPGLPGEERQWYICYIPIHKSVSKPGCLGFWNN